MPRSAGDPDDEARLPGVPGSLDELLLGIEKTLGYLKELGTGLEVLGGDARLRWIEVNLEALEDLSDAATRLVLTMTQVTELLGCPKDDVRLLEERGLLARAGDGYQMLSVLEFRRARAEQQRQLASALSSEAGSPEGLPEGRLTGTPRPRLR